MTSRLQTNRALSAIAPIVVSLGFAAGLAGCAGRSLNPPPVVDWSRGARPAVTSSADQPVLYTVRRQDTLASIAARFNTTPAALAALNDLGPDPRIRPDQILRVSQPQVSQTSPQAGTSPVATTAPVGSEAVEARPIGPPGVTMPSGGTAPGASNAPLKTGPLGLRKPYSDAALAELSKPDGEVAPGAATMAAAPGAAVGSSTPAPATAVGSLSWAWPVPGRPGRPFDDKSKGIDIPGKLGDPIVAAADGRVTFAGTGVRGYGNFVIVQHSPDLLSVYAHNRANLVKEGSTVVKGQKIAEMGSTDSDGVRLHFEIRRDSKPVDPLQYLPPR